MNSTSETANENFITDHGSIFFSCNRARRGPREAAAATVARTFRTASPTWVRAAPAPAAPTLADPTTLALPTDVPAPIIEVRAPLVCAAVGGPAGRVWVGGALVRGALVGGALVGAPGTFALPDPAAGGPDGFDAARSDEFSGGGTGGTEVPPCGGACWAGDDGEFTTEGRIPPGTLGAVGGLPPAPGAPAPELPEPPGAPGAPEAEGRAAPLEPDPDCAPGGVAPPG
jgi:hypothetical protein